MTDPKSRFLQNKDLVSKWHQVVSSEWFEEVIVYAQAQMFDSKATTEEREGARRFVTILCDLAEHDPRQPTYPSAGLNRNLDVPRRTLESAKPEKK